IEGELQLVLVVEGVGGGRAEVARVALRGIRAQVRQLQPDRRGWAATSRRDHRSRPDLLVKADIPAVQAGTAYGCRIGVRQVVVERDVVDDTLERELPVGDPVGVPADEGPEVGAKAVRVVVVGVRVVLDIVRQGWVTEGDVSHLAGSIREISRLDDAAVLEDVYDHAVAVAERVQVDGLAVYGGIIQSI